MNEDEIQEAMVYYMDKIKECIAEKQWFIALKYMNYLAKLIFYTGVIDERNGIILKP